MLGTDTWFSTVFIFLAMTAAAVVYFVPFSAALTAAGFLGFLGSSPFAAPAVDFLVLVPAFGFSLFTACWFRCGCTSESC